MFAVQESASMTVRMHVDSSSLSQRAVGVAILVLAADELMKTIARFSLTPCSSTRWEDCYKLEIAGPLALVRTVNAGSALGFRQGWWLWVGLAVCGVLFIPLYARWLTGGGWLAAIAIGLQIGGALGNALDRLLLGGASDVQYLGWGPTWNLADGALSVGAVLAFWALARRGKDASACRADVAKAPSPS
jgi:signal peptidase II